MKFDSNLIARIQQANDIIDVISEHLDLQKKGREMVGICPFHQDHKPSMYVNPEKQIFKCFACGAGGDVIKFVQMREGLTFFRTIERLADRAGIKIELPTQRRDSNSSPGFDPSTMQKMNAWTMEQLKENLKDETLGKVAREYIAQRKITPEMSDAFNLGFAPDSWDNFINAARQKKVPDSLSIAAGMIVARDTGGFYDKFRNRLMFPIIDAAGRVIGFGGRTLGDDPAKYMNSPATILFDKSNCVYGLDQARHQIVSTGTVVIVEGYTDVIMAHQFGCKNVVATLGTSLTPGHARLLRRYAKNIVLIFDSDIAGESAAERALEICLAEKIDIKVASVPQGKDPCDFLMAAGADAFNKLIETADDIMTYQWSRLDKKLNASDNMTDRRGAIDKFLQTIASALKAGSIDAITQGLIINRLSGILQINPDDIRKDLTTRLGRVNNANVQAMPNAKVTATPASEKNIGYLAQSEIIEVLLNRPALIESAKRKINAESFDVPQFNRLWLLLEENYDENTEFSLAAMLSQIEDSETAALAVRLSDNEQDTETLNNRLRHAIDALSDYNFRKSKNDSASDADDKLRKITELAAKPNRRNPGMISN